MNIKISAVILILLSFFNLGAVSKGIKVDETSFNSIEQNLRNISEFNENGVKLQYKTKNDINSENLRIKEYLTQNISENYKELQTDQFEVDNNDYNINAKFWGENQYTYVEVTITNKNPKLSTVDLKNMLRKLENKNLESMQYFIYYECKGITGNKDSLDKFIDQNNIQHVQLLEISNGYTGTGYLKDGNKVNFALIRYNTGSHIIIGTPIIFTTY
jgi:hypothetical protein